MMKTLIVQLSSHFERSISTRAAVQNLFTFNKKSINEVIIDFSEIYLISSSASHQFILEIRDLEKQDIIVTLKNVAEDINRMLEFAKTDRKNIFTVQNVKHLNVKSDKDLSSLLLEV